METAHRSGTLDPETGPGLQASKDAQEGEGVPSILKWCVRAIWELGTKEPGAPVMGEAEGVFRLASDADTMFALREDVSKGDYTVLKNRDKTRGLLHSPIEAADLLKQWLRNMPDPLLPYNIYNKGVDIGRTQGPEAVRAAVAVLTSALTGASGTAAAPSADATLDRPSFRTLRYLLHFCWELSAHESVTKMGVSNLALVMAPNIMKDESGDPLIFARNADAERGFVALLIDGIGQQLW